MSPERLAPPIPFPKERVDQVEFLVKKYSSLIRRPGNVSLTAGATKEDRAAVVLLTGSTGVLGSHILQHLIQDSRVDTLYTLDRPSPTPLHERQAKSFRVHSLDPAALSSTKLMSLEGSLLDHHFGLKPETYEKLINSVTVIIHNAWMINFKAPVLVFEPLIIGAVHLINFAHTLRTRKTQFVFSSSIISVQNFGCATNVPDAVIPDARVSLDIGYGEAKYVVERLLALSGLNSCSVRSPQLYLPEWPTSGWLPLVVKSSLALGQMPEFLGKVEWLPVDYAAKFTVDIALHRGDTLPQAVNIRHPHPVSFLDVLGWIQEAISGYRGQKLALPLVSLASWLKTLRRSGIRTGDVPALKLLAFYDAVVEREEHMERVPIVGGYPLVDLTTAHSVYPTLGQLKKLDKAAVAGWVDHWVKEKFFPPTIPARL
ncbi:hypothetical protein ONZ45_g7389 [Pleurotus djamor]|nr:hypothetical protein ONZ45_g7389 [Pleurotus djamor]